MTYNIFTCKGFGQGASYVAAGDCLPSRLIFVIWIFLAAVIQKWILGDDGGWTSPNFWIGLALMEMPYLIIITIFGTFKWAALSALIGGAVWIGLFYAGLLGGGE